MRLAKDQIEVIKETCAMVAGPNAKVRVFGSRMDDHARGGDLDLMLECAEPIANPALMASQIAGRVSRYMRGRKVDVVLSAPNLRHLPIHNVALQEGTLL